MWLCRCSRAATVPVDVPGGAALVRLERGPHHQPGHRRRIAGVVEWRRRGHPTSRCHSRLEPAALPANGFPDDPPSRRRIAMLRDWLDTEMADSKAALLAAGPPDLAVASSKTFRSLARLTGAAPSGAGPRVKRTLTANSLRQLIAFISRMTTADRAELEGVSAERAPQIVAGALVAEASMRALSLESVDICPGLCARASSCAASTARRTEPHWWRRPLGKSGPGIPAYRKADDDRRRALGRFRLPSCWPRTEHPRRRRRRASTSSSWEQRRGVGRRTDRRDPVIRTGEIPVVPEESTADAGMPKPSPSQSPTCSKSRNPTPNRWHPTLLTNRRCC